MVKVIYTRDASINMMGELEYAIMPMCPVCDEWTYGEDACPFCRMKGVHTPLEYDDKKYPVFVTADGSPVKRGSCGVCGGRQFMGNQNDWKGNKASIGKGERI